MNSSEEQKGTVVPPAGEASSPGSVHSGAPEVSKPEISTLAEPVVQAADPMDSYEDGYPHEPEPAAPVGQVEQTQAVATVPRRPGGGGKTPPPPPPPGGNGDD